MTTQTKRKPKVDYYVSLPEGVTIAKNPVTKFRYSTNEYFPISDMDVGDSFYVKGYTARDLRGVIHKRSRVGNRRFVSRTNKTGTGARVWRIK